ncbi:dual oxidase maturation factor 1-like [Saccoglossus kowalevskii]|uniref:Dual oxidase maturation factor 1-like n=1 Tax=Saccoglossus kowalevskii TaxID=10224 RepID=A0A0U2STP2_SACKO|nr:PREDICTED: dual oxidase maturation factor 1-like [Saccoglossus kowalevskii]ALR88705.1 dual oxidase maturation factor1-like 054 [Saccoglossus kowalevskii]
MESAKSSDGFFDAFRMYGLNPYYAPNKTAVTYDVLEAGLICAVLIVAFSFIVIVPGIRGKERLFACLRTALSLFVFAVIILANYGQEWETAKISTKTQYKAFTSEEINATIGVKIGLRSVNITVKGEPEKQIDETINYNERFGWSDGWNQGRLGFGPFAGPISREFRAAQYKGLPYPILWIVEYFTLDGEEIRWGRSYRTAGFFTHICMWLAFPLWLLTNILLLLVLRYGAFFMALTGIDMLLANLLFATLRSGPDLTIPFEDATLMFKYGWCFWLNLITGLFCVIASIIIVILDYRFPSALATFFNSDILQDYEDTVDENYSIASKQKLFSERNGANGEPDNSQAASSKLMDSDDTEGGRSHTSPDDESVFMNLDIKPVYRPRTASRFKVSRRKPRAAPRQPVQNVISEEDEEENNDSPYDYPPPPREAVDRDTSVKFKRDGREQHGEMELATYGTDESVVSLSISGIPVEEK